MSRPISELPQAILGFTDDLRGLLVDIAVTIKDRMSEPAEPITYPVNWDSEKQRRAFFATDGFGKGIPYSPTGASQNMFTVTQQPYGATLQAPHPAGALFGTPTLGGWQSSIHRGRRNNIFVVLSEELDKIPDEIRNAFEVRFRE